MAKKNDYTKKIDLSISEKIYQLRLESRMTRQQLANLIDVTCQQLSKYEKGTNRLTIGRLALIAKAFGKSLDYFYKDFDINEAEYKVTPHQKMCSEMTKNFLRIRNEEHQNMVNNLINSLSKG